MNGSGAVYVERGGVNPGGSNVKYIYLASPYSDPDPNVRQSRFMDICRYAGDCMLKGEFVFSPIAHSHPIAVLHLDIPEQGWDFWGPICRKQLGLASKMRVVKLDGWDKSVGIAGELEIAKELGLEVEYAMP